MSAKSGDLSVTALYTSQTWAWGELPCAHLFETREAKRVFDATNAALAAASLFRRGEPSLRCSLVHRHAMIDHLLRASGARYVLELAAGLSRRGAAFTADPGVHYTELDLPHVIEKKRALLERTDEGRRVLARPGLRLVAADVVEANLAPFAPRGEPLFVIAEGLMMYLSADAQRGLYAKVRRLGAIASRVSFVFDRVPPDEEPPPGRVGRALEAAMKRFTGGRSFEPDPRTRAGIVGDLRTVGFDEAEAIESGEVARAWQLPHPDERTRNVVFVAATSATVATPASASRP